MIRQIQQLKQLKAPDPVRLVRFSPDGSMLAASFFNQGRVMLWEIETGEEILTLGAQDKPIVDSVSFSSDNSLLAVGFRYDEVLVYNLDLCRQVPSVYFYGSQVMAVAFVLNQNLLVAFVTDDKFYLSGNGGARKAFPYSSLFLPVEACFAQNGKSIISFSCWRPSIEIWDTERKSLVHSLVNDEHACSTSCAVCSVDEKCIAFGAHSGAIKVCNFDSDIDAFHTYSDSLELKALAFDPKRRWLAAGSSQAITFWHLGNGSSFSLMAKRSWVRPLAFNPQGNLLASGSSNGIDLWDLSELEEL